MSMLRPFPPKRNSGCWLLCLIPALVALACTVQIGPVYAPTTVNYLAPTLHPAPVPPSKVAEVTAVQSVYIRQGPTWQSPAVSYLYHGQTIHILGCVDGWARVSGGYINSAYLSVPCEVK
jgi:uncharacterized protein YgiM (DUF1202 family)